MTSQRMNATCPTVEKSVDALGFNFADVKICWQPRAWRSSGVGDQLVKELTGSQVIEMARRCLPRAPEESSPCCKEQPIEIGIITRWRIRWTLGDTTLVAHLTAGSTSALAAPPGNHEKLKKTAETLRRCLPLQPAARPVQLRRRLWRIFTRSFPYGAIAGMMVSPLGIIPPGPLTTWPRRSSLNSIAAARILFIALLAVTSKLTWMKRCSQGPSFTTEAKAGH